MNSNDIIQLGPIQLPLSWVILFIGLIISTIIVDRLARKKGWKKGEWSDILITLSLIFILVYKFGWVIFDIESVINKPSSLIFISGSSIKMAITLSLLVFIYKIYKQKLPFTDILDFVFLTFTITFFFYSLFIMDYGKTTNFFLGVKIDDITNFKYHPVNWYRTFWLGILLIARFRISSSNITMARLTHLYILLGIGLLLISIFDIAINLIYGLTIEQWIYIIITFLAVLGYIKFSKKK